MKRCLTYFYLLFISVKDLRVNCITEAQLPFCQEKPSIEKNFKKGQETHQFTENINATKIFPQRETTDSNCCGKRSTVTSR